MSVVFIILEGVSPLWKEVMYHIVPAILTARSPQRCEQHCPQL